MSKRKKSLLLFVVGVCLCGILFLLISSQIQKRDREEFIKQCKEYEGVWKDRENKFAVDIFRVTDGNIAFSLHNREFRCNAEFMTGYSVGNGYEFTYNAVRLGGNTYRVHAGSNGVGHIYLKDDKILIDIPQMKDKPHILEFQGELMKSHSLPEEDTVRLMTYMGTKKQLPDKLKKFCSLLYDEKGEVWRIRAVSDEDHCYTRTDVDGISFCTFQSECENKLGKAGRNCELSGGLQKSVYEKGDYVYSVIRNEFGMVIEIDCQKRNLPGTIREGDFILKGSTLLKYTGDYRQTGDVNDYLDLPENVGRIASHAFELGENGLGGADREIGKRILNIPEDVEIEEDAFYHCGPLIIQLEEGRKVIPKRAFAHMTALENKEDRKSWVTIILPNSLERIEEEAFALDNSTQGLQDYWDSFRGETNPSQPIALEFDQSRLSVRYIGDNALWGIRLMGLPNKVRYLGKNITLSTMFTISIPQGVTELHKDTFFLYGSEGAEVEIGPNMRKIDKGAFRSAHKGNGIIKITIDKENQYLHSFDKISD